MVVVVMMVMFGERRGGGRGREWDIGSWLWGWREREKNPVLRKYDKSVLFIWSNG